MRARVGRRIEDDEQAQPEGSNKSEKLGKTTDDRMTEELDRIISGP